MSEGAADIGADRIDALLPQTQCRRCGYSGCRPYAEAISNGDAEINQCPPGGESTIERLANLLRRPATALNPANGIETAPAVAWIDASRCIGCAKCLPPCPVDAILGAAKNLHTIVAERCTGCELCVAPCPVDCIQMRPAPSGYLPVAASKNRQRYDAHLLREQRRLDDRARELQQKKAALHTQVGRSRAGPAVRAR